MKRKVQHLLYAALCTVGILCSCSKNTDTPDTDNGVQVAAGNITFSLSAVPFGSDTEMGTRAVATTETAYLGNGIEAEMTLEAEPPTQEEATRAPLPLNGHYHIYAFKADGTYIGKISGTIASGAFTLDAGSDYRIAVDEHVPISFVCTNDDVDFDGTRLTIDKAKAATAMIAVQTQTVSGRKQKVAFALKHAAARVRTKLVTYMPVASATAALTSGSSAVATKVALKPAENDYQSVATGTMSDARTYIDNDELEGDTVYVAQETAGYTYVLPGTPIANVALQFTGGTIYEKALSSLPARTFASTAKFAANGSYTVKLKLAKAFTYLFNDGTTGLYSNKGSRIPIGIVVKDGLAMAIKTMQSNWKATTATNWGSTDSNVQYKDKFALAYSTENGYEETWDEAYAPGAFGTSKAESLTPPLGPGMYPMVQYDLFYGAGHYSTYLSYPSGLNIPLSNGMDSKKWFVPSVAEWKVAFKALGYLDESTISNWSNDFTTGGKWYGVLANSALRKVGGNEFLPYMWEWCSNEYDADNGTHIHTTNKYLTFSYISKHGGYMYRPFVKYK